MAEGGGRIRMRSWTDRFRRTSTSRNLGLHAYFFWWGGFWGGGGLGGDGTLARGICRKDLTSRAAISKHEKWTPGARGIRFSAVGLRPDYQLIFRRAATPGTNGGFDPIRPDKQSCPEPKAAGGEAFDKYAKAPVLPRNRALPAGCRRRPESVTLL